VSAIGFYVYVNEP